MKAALPLIALLALSGCEAPPAEPEAPAAPAAPVPPSPPAAPGSPAAPTPPAPMLSPLTRADWESRLEPGFGCSLERGGDVLLIAVSGDAVARINGSPPRDLTGAPTDLNALSRGGRYDAGFATIDIALAPDLGESTAAEEVMNQPARVTVTSGTRREQFEAVWACGS